MKMACGSAGGAIPDHESGNMRQYLIDGRLDFSPRVLPFFAFDDVFGGGGISQCIGKCSFSPCP